MQRKEKESQACGTMDLSGTLIAVKQLKAKWKPGAEMKHCVFLCWAGPRTLKIQHVLEFEVSYLCLNYMCF